MKQRNYTIGDLRREIMGQPWAIHSRTLDTITASCNPSEFKAGIMEELKSQMDEVEATEVVNGVAVINVNGVITKRPNLMQALLGGVTMVSALQQQFRMAMESDARCVILAFDTPGGAVSGTPELASEIFTSKGKSDKLVVASVEGMCCSGGWWLASQCDAIYCTEASIMGSMSVIATVIDDSRAMKNEGYDLKTYASNSLKTGEGPEFDRSMTAQVAKFHQMFVEAVARGRGISIAQSEKMADAQTHIGADAVAAGFADGLATLDQVISMYQTKPKTGNA